MYKNLLTKSCIPKFFFFFFLHLEIKVVLATMLTPNTHTKKLTVFNNTTNNTKTGCTFTLNWVGEPCRSHSADSLSRSSVTQLLCGLREVTCRAGVSFHDYTASIEPIGILRWHLWGQRAASEHHICTSDMGGGGGGVGGVCFWQMFDWFRQI